MESAIELDIVEPALMRVCSKG